MEPDLPGVVVPVQVEVWAEEAEVPGEWEAAVPGLARVAIVSAPLAGPGYLIRWGCPAIT